MRSGLETGKYTERKVCMQRRIFRSRRLTACAAAAVLAASTLAGGAFPLPVSADTDQIVEYSLLAGGSRIGMNVYIRAQGRFSNVTVDNGNWEDYDSLDGGGIVVHLPVKAPEMRSEYTISYQIDGTDYTLPDVSAVDYLRNLLRDNSTTAERYHAVARAMLEYGFAAEDYFSGADFADYGMAVAPDFSSVTIKEGKFTGKEKYNADLEAKNMPYRYYGMNLTLLDEIQFSLYFENEENSTYLTDGFFGEDATAKYFTFAGEGFARLWKNIPASRLTDRFVCWHAPASPVSFRPVNYLAAAVEGTNKKLTAVCKALYAYGEAAKAAQPKLCVSEYEKAGWATFYDYGGAFPAGNALLDDFIEENGMNIAALTDEDYQKYVGGYIRVERGDKSVCALVGDILPMDSDNPDARPGDVDLNEDAFTEIADKTEGRVNVLWQLIPLPTAAEAPVSYMVKEGSNLDWCGIQVRNTTYPVAKLEWSVSGSDYIEARRMSGCYNYFEIFPNGSEKVRFRITDIFGQVITDWEVTLPLTGENSTEVLPAEGSGVQFGI